MVSLFVVLLASCGEPDIPTNRTPSDGGVSFLDDGGTISDDDGGGPPATGCPDNIPTRGSSCGPGTDESTSCEFPTGTCSANGMTYNETAIYCCPNGYWEPCGGASPCDNVIDAAEPPPPVDAGVGDGASAVDASGDALDGGIDITTD